MDSLTPLYMFVESNNKDFESRVSVAILLPSGVGRNTDEYKVQACPDGKSLEITITWPKGMSNPDVIRKAWT